MIATVSPEPEQLTRGHKKRSRTRLLLLEAAQQALAELGDGFAIVDVVQRAGVSQGTFYNYFDDREQLLEALVPFTVGAFAAQAAIDVDEPDPAVRFATISALALQMAATYPTLVAVALNLEAVQRALFVDGPLSYLLSDLRAGHESGRFVVAPNDATLDVILGGLLLAARRLVAGNASVRYRSDVIRHLLLTLGLDAEDAAGIADRVCR